MAEKNAESKQFEQHFKQLEKLSSELQDNKVSIDELVPRMKAALDSIKVCKTVLKETKSQLHEITAAFREMEADEVPPVAE